VHPETFITQCLEKYWTYFYLYQTFSIGAFWHKDERFNFLVRRSKFNVTVESNMLENALIGHVVIS